MDVSIMFQMLRRLKIISPTLLQNRARHNGSSAFAEDEFAEDDSSTEDAWPTSSQRGITGQLGGVGDHGSRSKVL